MAVISKRVHFGLLLAALVLLMLAGCGGGRGGAPQPGPYSGSFFAGAEVVGNLTLTANATTVTGTGSLTHNEQPVAVAIAATINGKSFSGFVSNASLGSGEFVGSFHGSQLSGTYSYTDAGGISTTSGTWSALIEN